MEKIFFNLQLVTIPWDIEEYYLKCIKPRRQRDKAEFPDIFLGCHDSLLTVVEARIGYVLLPPLKDDGSDVETETEDDPSGNDIDSKFHSCGNNF